MHGLGHGWTMGFGWLFGLAIIIVLALLIIKMFNQRVSAHDKEKTSLDILKERYAKGEIDEEQFEKQKQKLKE